MTTTGPVVASKDPLMLTFALYFMLSATRTARAASINYHFSPSGCDTSEIVKGSEVPVDDIGRPVDP